MSSLVPTLNALKSRLEAIVYDDGSAVFTSVIIGGSQETLKTRGNYPVAMIQPFSSNWDGENPELGKVSVSVICLVVDYSDSAGANAVIDNKGLTRIYDAVVAGAGHMGGSPYMSAATVASASGPQRWHFGTINTYAMTIDMEVTRG